MEVYLSEVKQTIQDIEKAIGTGGGGDKDKFNKGYIPLKNNMPKMFSDKLEEWRAWHEDVAEYFDSVNPGMKKI